MTNRSTLRDRIRARVDWATTSADFVTGHGTATDIDTGERLAFVGDWRPMQDLALRVALFDERPEIDLRPDQVTLRRVQ